MKNLDIKDKNILYLRKVIKETIIKEMSIGEFNNLKIVTVELVDNLIKHYNFYVLDNYLSEYVKDGIITSLSKRMTSSGGKTIYYKKKKSKAFEIRISLLILEKYISSNYKGKICGIEGQDVLDGLMIILEHELCHVLEFAAYGSSSCKGQRFKSMAWKLFRHGTSTHEILSSTDINEGTIVKVGHKVTFQYKGQNHFGIIANINKRATVMVEDANGRYKDKQGNTFNKWYVPLTMLKGE